jgi:hypothetical protein
MEVIKKMRKVKRFGIILGIILTIIILISGSAVAAWVYVTVYDYDDCTNIYEIEGTDDDTYATLGENPSTLGWVILDLGSGNEMPPSQDFTVFTYSTESENYAVSVSTGALPDDWVPVNDQVIGDDDLDDHDFTTPSTPLKLWRYIKLVGLSGSVTMGDPTYGPEIDAVGWDKP